MLNSESSSSNLKPMRVSFPLSVTDASARLAIRANGPLSPKDYVFKIQFPGVDSTRDVARDLKLFFSEGLASLYLYNNGQKEMQIGHTKFFHLPAGVESMTVEVQRWAKEGEVARIERVDLQVKAPWERLGKLTQIGMPANG